MENCNFWLKLNKNPPLVNAQVRYFETAEFKTQTQIGQVFN